MIQKEELEKVSKLKIECENIRKRLDKLDKIAIDSVSGSSKTFPYIQHTCKIEGIIDSKGKRKLKKMLKNKEAEISKKIVKIEYELNYIDDSEIRQIIRYKYEDCMTNYQVAIKMNKDFKTEKYNEDNIRMKLNRFFEKN